MRGLQAARQDAPMLPAPEAEADPELAELTQRWVQNVDIVQRHALMCQADEGLRA